MKVKVLVVDDSSLARRSARQLLEGLGHTVEEAPDGAQGLERLFINPPELVLLDVVMSGMSGLDVLAKMRGMNPSVKVVIVTADIQHSTAEQARLAGAKGVVNKPINREKLKAALDAVLTGGDLWS